MFMPDRLHDGNERSRNEANFRSLARTMMEHQVVSMKYHYRLYLMV